jgi:hypothetical protein
VVAAVGNGGWVGGDGRSSPKQRWMTSSSERQRAASPLRLRPSSEWCGLGQRLPMSGDGWRLPHGSSSERRAPAAMADARRAGGRRLVKGSRQRASGWAGGGGGDWQQRQRVIVSEKWARAAAHV